MSAIQRFHCILKCDDCIHVDNKLNTPPKKNVKLESNLIWIGDYVTCITRCGRRFLQTSKKLPRDIRKWSFHSDSVTVLTIKFTRHVSVRPFFTQYDIFCILIKMLLFWKTIHFIPLLAYFQKVMFVTCNINICNEHEI